jgi:ADP-ribose pyrophosphatase
MLKNLSKSVDAVNEMNIAIIRTMRLSKRHRERFRKTLHKYAGNAVGFRSDQITLPDGRAGVREYLSHPGAVGVLAFETPNKILLVKQYRYPVEEFTYEIPAGKLAAGEDPLSCVKRELEEETGFKAKRIRKMMSFWPTAAFSNEVIHLYLADHLQPTRAHPDDDEFLEIVKVSPRSLERRIRRGQIRDSKTIIAYLYWRGCFRCGL